MANHRLIHKEAATGARTTGLDALEFRVWVQYLLSADDFGVCPALALKLQGDNRWLAKQPTKRVQAAIERLITIGLVEVFFDQDNRYLYQSDWQDWQRFKHATATSLPPIPAESLSQCSPKTVSLFSEFHSKVRKTLPPRAGACDAPANANAPASDLSLEESLRETSPPRSRPVSAAGMSPLAWGNKHSEHVTGFCDWMCFPADLAQQFAARFNPSDPEAGLVDVRDWARSVRRAWESNAATPTGKMYDFWNNRWTEEHGEVKPSSDGAAGKQQRTRAALARFVERG